MDKNTEIELKLLVSKSDLKKLLALDFVSAAIRPDSCRKRRVISSYYDTADWAFKNNGVAYRVRSNGDGTYEATVKTTLQNSAGLSERRELTVPLTSAKPKLDGFAELGLAEDLRELAPDGVGKKFTVNVQRTTYLIDWEGAVIELAVDRGKITAGAASDKIDEIELELKEGEAGTLLAFAAKLAAAAPLFAEPRSKFARGLALCGVEADKPAAKNKLGDGPALPELLKAAQRCGDALLLWQNKIKDGAENIEGAALKETRRQLAALRSLLAVGAELAGEDCRDAARLREAFAVVERLGALRALLRLWLALYERNKEILGRGYLTKKLNALVAEENEKLVSLALRGELTAAVYEAAARLYAVKPTCGEQTALAAARACVKNWQKLADEKAEIVENICALARLADGKFFAKALAAAKKQRRQLQKHNVAALWRQALDVCCETSTSKLVYRDAGIVLGYILAKEK